MHLLPAQILPFGGFVHAGIFLTYICRPSCDLHSLLLSLYPTQQLKSPSLEIR